jgi:chorismate mutase / prephenate dehydratase
MTGRETSLADIRNEIDAIDDGIVDLLARRAAAQRKVKARKTADGGLAISPLRPAREAEILRRIVRRGGKAVDPELLVRLWRSILVSSTLSQAPVKLHIGHPLPDTGLLAAYFGPMPLVEHTSTREAISKLAEAPGDLCAVESGGDWTEAFRTGINGPARVIGVVPILASDGVPPLLLLGHAEAQPSGDDCTLLILPRGGNESGLWTLETSAARLLCLKGFHSDEDLAAAGFSGATVAGRFPDQIKA